MGMSQALMQILKKHIFGCLRTASFSFLTVPLFRTNLNPCFCVSILILSKMGLERLNGCCVCTLTSVMILTVQGQRWGLARIHHWCSDNGPVLGMVLHALPSLFDMFRHKRPGCRCKGLHKPSSKSGEAVSI